MDRVRRLVVALVVLVVAGLVVLVVTVRPGLRDDAESVDRTWKPLVAQLDLRYRSLVGVRDAMVAAGLDQRSVTVALGRTLDHWKIVSTGTDAEDQVATANRLEALAARADALAHTPRLLKIAALRAAIDAFVKARPAPTVLADYNDHAARYQVARTGFWDRIVARLDGYPMRPTLQLLA